ncbi:MAG: ATP-dependent helicase [Deltaproteobacteria bacterium]|nr:ATP-dependent helicase [Deltaproteobacteria bacterium]
MPPGRRYVLEDGGALRRVDFERELNPEQLGVVTAGCGPVLCIAGAGTGKTRTVTYRVAWLVESGVAPESIVLCTFTNKAAREMLTRVGVLTGGAASRVLGGTFHHIANVILRRYAELAGFRSSFGILDDGDAAELVGSVTAGTAFKDGAGTGAPLPKPDLLLTVFGLAVNTCRTPEDVVLDQFPYLFPFVSWIGRVRDAFEERKVELNVMDFDGLLRRCRDLLERNPEVRVALTARFQHVLVDEYQDTTRIQGDIVALLSGGPGAPGGAGTDVRAGRGLMVVGDDAQSIYSFRGATVANMIEFPKRYPGCNVLTLTRNYRSTPQVLSLANRVLARNQGQFNKVLSAERGDGPLPAYATFRDGDEQAAFVAQRAAELVEEGVGLSGIAVLYRAHSHSLEVQMALARRGIPFVVRSGVRFFEQAHIKDALSLLRFMGNPSDELAARRLLKLFPGIGNATAEAAAAAIRVRAAEMPDFAANKAFQPAAVKGRAHAGFRKFQAILRGALEPGIRDNPSEALGLFLKAHYREVLESRYPDAPARRDDIEQLAAFAARYATLDDFLREIALLTNIEAEQVRPREEGEREFLTLSSVHQAKGLEWRAVFVIWLCDGRFPSALAIKTLAGEEEERRLFYVAVTRAKDELYLCQPMSAFARDREMKILRPSRFVAEIPDFQTVTERWSVGREEPADVPF